MQSNMNFRKALSSNSPSIILVGGIFFDLLLLALFLFLSKANRDALHHADQVTLRLSHKAIDLQNSNKDLEDFSYIASHDLKSPLNSIRQLAIWIKEDCEDVLPAESKEHLFLLQSRVDRMMKLLKDLLNYSHINRFAHSNNNLNLNDTVVECFEMLGHPTGFTFDAPDIQISIPVTPFEIVLRNLISNSIKHHNQDTGHIKVTYQELDKFHYISFTDDGPGIPPIFQDKVMEMFQTLKPRDKVEGSGMGLAFVKKIVEHHGGMVEIESDGQSFTTFIIKWPLDTSNPDT